MIDTGIVAIVKTEWNMCKEISVFSGLSTKMEPAAVIFNPFFKWDVKLLTILGFLYPKDGIRKWILCIVLFVKLNLEIQFLISAKKEMSELTINLFGITMAAQMMVSD